MKKKLQIQNKHPMEVAIRGKLSGKNPKLRNGEKEEMGDRGRKCFYHEYSKCINQKCELRHPSKVCKDHNMNKCYLGKYCDNNHPKKNCTLWA